MLPESPDTAAFPDQPRVRRRGSHRWSRVSIDVLRDPALSAQAKAVYAVLATYADDAGRDQCYPRQETLAEQLGVSVDTVQRHIKALEDAGVVEVVPRFRPDGGRSSNDYTLLDELSAGGSTPSKGRTGAVSPHPTDPATPNRTDAASRGTAPVLDQHQLNTPLPPEGEGALFAAPAAPPTSDLSAEFVDFWKLYPRRTAKGAAETRYRAARKLATRDQIFAALATMLPTYAETDQRFIPHPATWLHQQRWLDEVEPAPAPEPGYLRPHQLERAPDGMTDAESAAWMREQAAKQAGA